MNMKVKKQGIKIINCKKKEMISLTKNLVLFKRFQDPKQNILSIQEKLSSTDSEVIYIFYLIYDTKFESDE